MSLLRDIQADLARESGDVTTVLRKCKILAARLGSIEFANWVDWELDGYPSSQEIPAYRRLTTIYYAAFMDVAWRVPKQAVPLQIIPEEFRESYTYIPFTDGIAKATTFTRNGTGAVIQKPDLIWSVQGKMYPRMQCHQVWAEISGIEFEQLISAVKNKILDFSLKIEAENPDAGEAPPNSQPVPVERLQTILHNTFNGPVGNIAQNSEQFSQTATFKISNEDIQKLVAHFDEHLSELDLDQQRTQLAKAQLATLKAQLTVDPDPTILRQAGRSLRKVTEGAIGSLLATSVQDPTLWRGIQSLLDAF